MIFICRMKKIFVYILHVIQILSQKPHDCKKVNATINMVNNNCKFGKHDILKHIRTCSI